MTRQTYPSTAGEITLLTLTNASGATVVLTSVGAGIVSVKVPDKNGKIEDVCLGYADPTFYLGDGPCFGKTPGRYANRIAKGHFSIDGVEYTLPINNGPNCNHGGPEGFNNQIWNVESAEGNTVVFSYDSKDGEAGFPGNLHASVKYVWTDDNSLEITFRAETDAKTVVNLTNHAYWNLAGHNSGSVFGNKLQIMASRYLPTDPTQIPTGELAPVAGTPMDFTAAKEIGQDINAEFEALKIGKGYDHCWVVDDYVPGKARTVAILSEDNSGRVLEVVSDQPGAQVYTGNWLSGSEANKDGRHYNDYDGVAIECQDFPNSPNTPSFPSTLLCPGEKYERHITYKFTTK